MVTPPSYALRDGDGPNASFGLVVDEWIEKVPSKHHDSAISFHFDAPSSRPPQTVLLALPLEDEKRWLLGNVIDTVRDTLRWMRLRAVTPDDLRGLSHYLPAIFSPELLKGSEDSP
jgi:hypothetical protein